MSNQPPYGGYQGGGFSPPEGKTKTLGLDYKIAGLLCYLPICCINVIAPIMWLVSEPRENKFLRFHALQGLFLIGAWIVFLVVFFILGVGGMAAMPSDAAGAAGGGILSLLYLAAWGVFVILCIVAMVKAYQGQMWKIPLIGQLADKNS